MSCQELIYILGLGIYLIFFSVVSVFIPILFVLIDLINLAVGAFNLGHLPNGKEMIMMKKEKDEPNVYITKFFLEVYDKKEIILIQLVLLMILANVCFDIWYSSSCKEIDYLALISVFSFLLTTNLWFLVFKRQKHKKDFATNRSKS